MIKVPFRKNKLSSGFPTRADTNQPVQAQKMARGLEFRIQKIEGLYYLSFYVAAYLIYAFVFTYAQSRFSHDATQLKNHFC